MSDGTQTWAAVAAVAAAISAVASLAGIAVQARSATSTRSIDVWLRMEAIFDSRKLRKARAQAARDLQLGNEASAEVDAVVDFFESLGYLVRTKVIDDRLVWHSFYYWTSNLGVAAAGYVAEGRAEDLTVWEDFQWLVDHLNSLQLRLKRSLSTVITTGDTEEFLKGEAAVDL